MTLRGQQGQIQRVRVALGTRSYDICIGSGLLPRVGELLAALETGRRVVVIADARVHRLYGATLLKGLAAAGFEPAALCVPTGEASKSMERVTWILEKLPALGLDRQSVVVALGGGVVGDLAGFVAAIYLRGVHFVQVPTTLLAMVDSAVGGKTGVNLPQGKNLVGAFYQPRLVVADTDTLRTLPKRQLRAGFAEVVKYGAIADARFFAWLERHYGKVLQLQPAAVAHVVRRCCQIKADVVAADERESGLRAILNFGHTVGHAIEAVSDYKGWLHGEAVAVGMVCAARLSVKHAGLTAEAAQRLEKLLAASGLPTRLGGKLPRSRLIAAARLDKKVRAGRLRFVLLRRLGEAVVSDQVGEADLQEVLDVCS